MRQMIVCFGGKNAFAYSETRRFFFKQSHTGGDHVSQGRHIARFRRARAGDRRVLEAEPYLRKIGRKERGRGGVLLLRRPPDRQRQAAHRAYPDARHEGHHPALSDDEGQARPAQGGLGYARAARGAGSGKIFGARRQEGDRNVRHQALQRTVQALGMEIYRRMAQDERPRRLLVRHGQPLCHLSRRLYRIRLVGAQRDRQEGAFIQGAQDRSLLPSLRHGALLARSRAGL